MRSAATTASAACSACCRRSRSPTSCSSCSCSWAVRSRSSRPPSAGRSRRLRFLLLLSWGVYPIAYLLPLLNIGGRDAWVAKQIGYSIADIVAKAVYGLIILQRRPDEVASPRTRKFAALEEGEGDVEVAAPVHR